MFAFGLQAKERSIVLIVKVDAVTQIKANDMARRNIAMIYKTCATRDVDTRFFQWRGDAARLTAFINSTGCEFVFFVGSSSYRPRYYTYPTAANGGDNIAHFWGQESAYCDVPAMVMLYGGKNDNDTYVSGAHASNDEAVSPNSYFYTANYSGELDTIAIFEDDDVNLPYVVAVNPAIDGVDSILTYAKYETNNWEHYMGLWSRTSDGVIRYYCTLVNGTVGAVIDAIMCKHITQFRKVQHAIDFSGFGKHYFKTGPTANLTAYTFPNTGDVALTHDNFFARIDSLTQKLIRYNFKASYVTTTKFLKSYHADSNQWSEWDALAQKYKDNSSIQFVVGSIESENPNDLSMIMFNNIAAYAASPYDENNPPTVAYMDSLYQDTCDSIGAWGLKIPKYIFTDNNLGGYYGDLQDTIIAFLKLNGLSTKQQGITEESRGAGWGVYWDNTKRDGVRIYLAMHGTSSRDDYLGLDERGNKMFYCFWQPWLWGVYNLDGLNPGVEKTGNWHDSRKIFNGNEYSTPQNRVNWFNFGACYNTGNWSRAEMYIEELGKTIEYLEWLAGKDIYECRFAQNIDWEQVR